MRSSLLKTVIKEFFYRREIEIYRVANENIYGIREVWRSIIKSPDGVSGWRRYSNREGNKIQMTTEQMQELIKEADNFVRKMK